MKAGLLLISAVLCSIFPLLAQVNHGGTVELLDATEDNSEVLFQVDGIASKKGDAALSARETLFYRLFHEGVEGINDDKPLVTKSKNYFVENFFLGKTAAMNRFVIREELRGAVNRNVDGLYVGTYELTVNLKALFNALKKAGATDTPVVRAAPPKKQAVGIGANKKQAASETVAPVTQPAESAPAGYTMTGQGIGPVIIGKQVSTLPKSIPGLYDKLEKVSRTESFEGGEEEVLTYCQAKLGQEVVFEFLENEKVDGLRVYSKKLTTTRGLGLQATPADLFSAGGKVLEGNDGVEGVLCEGILYVNIPFTQTGQKKANQSYLGEVVSFNVSDFVAGSHAEVLVIASWL